MVETPNYRIPWWKRLADILVSIAVLVLFSPLMLAIALWVKLSSRGPIFYVGRRAGLGGRVFGQIKFRTMHVNADRLGSVTGKNDPRIIPGGRLLRLLRFDELPQFVNILGGDMSVVGPRPEDPETVERFYTPEQRQVLAVLPGMTCLRQVKFFPDCSASQPPDVEDPLRYYREVVLPKTLAMDLEYVRKQSLWYDIYLIAATAYAIGVKSWAVPLLRNVKSRNAGAVPAAAGANPSHEG